MNIRTRGTRRQFKIEFKFVSAKLGKLFKNVSHAENKGQKKKQLLATPEIHCPVLTGKNMEIDRVKQHEREREREKIINSRRWFILPSAGGEKWDADSNWQTHLSPKCQRV